MDKNFFKRPLQGVAKRRFLFLLIAILAMVIGRPFLDDLFPFRFIRDGFITLIFVTAINAISPKKHHLVIGTLLAVPMLIAVWSYYIVKKPYLIVTGEFFGAWFIAFVIISLIGFILKEKEVTQDVIYAAVVIYLLMAMLWSFAYTLLEFIYPDSFSFAGGPREDIYRFLYFSFITITTLGYGDITPLTPKASSLVVLEAVTGQLYLVVIVAWLVGMHVSRKSK